MALKMLVTAKRVEDPESKIRVKPDGSGIVTDGVNYKLNPFCEIAVEEALRIQEKHGGEVVVASIGGERARTEVRTALAMGADRAILVEAAGRSTRWWCQGAGEGGRGRRSPTSS